MPPEILAAAPQRPFVFPPEMFAAPAPDRRQQSRSSQLAAAALSGGGSVLDVGCGGGAAAFAVAPPATHVIGVDRQEDMLRLFAATAAERGVPAQTVPGPWPEAASEVPTADVVVCHNVLYNVPDLVPFVRSLHEHARRRVVIEITERHPQVARAPLWQHFWNLPRPTGPTAELAVEALREVESGPVVERSSATVGDADLAAQVQAAFWCRQLCLPTERESEVAALLPDLVFPPERVTLWWDVDQSARPSPRLPRAESRRSGRGA